MLHRSRLAQGAEGIIMLGPQKTSLSFLLPRYGCFHSWIYSHKSQAHHYFIIIESYHIHTPHVLEYSFISISYTLQLLMENPFTSHQMAIYPTATKFMTSLWEILFLTTTRGESVSFLVMLIMTKYILTTRF